VESGRASYFLPWNSGRCTETLGLLSGVRQSDEGECIAERESVPQPIRASLEQPVAEQPSPTPVPTYSKPETLKAFSPCDLTGDMAGQQLKVAGEIAFIDNIGHNGFNMSA
jgi:hypothetical protein